MEARVIVETKRKRVAGPPMVSVSVELREDSWRRTEAFLIEDGDGAFKRAQLNKAIPRFLRTEGRPQTFTWVDG